MSDQMHDQQQVRGFYLVEDARPHLERLSASLGRLRRLTRPVAMGDQPPSPDWEQWSSGLDRLAEQVGQLLGAPSGSARRTVQTDDPEASGDASVSLREPRDAQAGVLPETGYQRNADPVVFGLTMDQFDALDRLMQTIQAHGDVVSASGGADFAQGTLPMVGHAIFDGAMAVREILDQVEMQTLPAPTHRPAGVAENRVVYATTAPDSAPAERGRLH